MILLAFLTYTAALVAWVARSVTRGGWAWRLGVERGMPAHAALALFGGLFAWALVAAVGAHLTLDP